MIWLGVWRLRFTVSGSSLPIVVDEKNSQTDRSQGVGLGCAFLTSVT
jgi:hypothetical protein